MKERQIIDMKTGRGRWLTWVAVVYVGSMDYKIYAQDASMGSKLWEYATENEVYSSPAVVNGAVYVGSADFGVYAFRADVVSAAPPGVRPQPACSPEETPPPAQNADF